LTVITHEIRAATLADKDELLELARFLDSVNLPHDEATISEILQHSERSFSGEIEDPRKRAYVFVLRDCERRQAVATSMVIGQLGRRDAPYIYYDVHVEERYSATLDRHFTHRVLTMGYSYDGPTEIGGLVVHPAFRQSTLGMLISYVRFLFIGARRSLFQDRILAELLPPLEADGTSYLWEALGRHFTGLTYRDADRLSKRNKEFIRGLFPDGDIYVSLLSPEAQSVIGKVGPQTRGVEKLLRRIGFRYWNRVDPFDGGPHFVAQTDEIDLVQRTEAVQLVATHDSSAADRALVSTGGDRALIATISPEPPYFTAVSSAFRRASKGISVPIETAERLDAKGTSPVFLLPIHASRKKETDRI
jgi:arginine N-succinyltransferase